MEINTKKLPKNIYEITVELSVLEMAPFNEKALEELAKEIEIPGWRKGKVPIKMARQYIMEAKLLEKTAEIAINQKYPQIITAENLNPCGPPEVSIQKLAPHNPFIFKLTIPLVPGITLGDWKKIKVRKKDIHIDQKHIDNTLDELRWEKRKEIMSLRPGNFGDRIEVDLNLFINNVPIEGGQTKNFSLVIGRDEHLLPGISKNFIGASAGEEKEFSHQYPDNHYDKKLAGQMVNFRAKINNIYTVELPELNDELAQALGDFKTLDELKEKIKQSLENEARRKDEQRLETEILKQIIEKSDFEEIPDVLINHEIDKMINELKASVEGLGRENGPTFNEYLQSIKKTQDEIKKEFLPQAHERIKTALAIREIAKQENITVSEKDLKQEMDKLAQLYTGQAQHQNPEGEQAPYGAGKYGTGQAKMLESLKTNDGKVYLTNLITNQKIITYLLNTLT